MARAGLILDRDGTIVEERGYVTEPGDLVVLPGVAECLAKARQAGLMIAVATNQSAVARGLLTPEALDDLHRRLSDELPIDAIFACVHHPDDGCSCRKPQSGLVEDAVARLDLDRTRVLLVGDHLSDCEAARRANVRAALVRTGHGLRHEAAARRADYPVFDDVTAAVHAFLAEMAG